MNNRAHMATSLAVLGVLAAMAGCTFAAPQDLKTPSIQSPEVRTAYQRHSCDERVSATIKVDASHPWKPPFGVQRVGAPPVVYVELTSEQALRREYSVIAYRGDREIERRSLNPEPNAARRSSKKSTSDALHFFAHSPLTSFPERVVLHAQCPSTGQVEELTRHRVMWPDLVADAEARPDYRLNPVDLGAILVPHDRLVLVKGQTAVISAAAISYTRDISRARLRAWFDGGEAVEASFSLKTNHRVVTELRLPLAAKSDVTVLHMSLTENGRELWTKNIHTMVVAQPPKWPAFGAVETQLRYDAPISVQDRKTKTSSSLPYKRGWNPQFNDVVVFLPNGTRFVFWRGSSYVPFWAGLYNTGFSYQWAETIAQPGFVDGVEPLHDKELRYSRVRIIESTASRVHVRWTYQSVDVNYKKTGDEVAEDFYFYPDGFGTRVITLATARPQEYVYSEFLILLPQAAFPFEVLSPRVDMLFLNGLKKRIDFPLEPGSYTPMSLPFPEEKKGADYHAVERLLAQYFRYRAEEGEEVSADRVDAMNHFLGKISYPPGALMYRVADHKDDAATPIYFSPDPSGSLIVFPPFNDRGQRVTPAYWGDHWPLGRGALTGGAISDRIHSSPSHLGLMDLSEPGPLSAGTRQMLDANGNARLMAVETRAWLIAKTDMSDSELLKWAQSFSSPPSLKLAGARVDLPSYSQERRAIRLILEALAIQIDVKPAQYLINPVFELGQAPKTLASVTLDGRVLAAGEYAWDGATLWVKSTIDHRGATIGLRFLKG